jgi:phosphoglucomutase
VAHINDVVKSGTSYTSQLTSSKFTISSLSDFEYTDPTDGTKTSKQGQVITFTDGSRVVFRLSGTGSQGATVRMYVERYVPAEAGAEELARDAAEGLKGLIEVALELSRLKEFLGTDQPTVITVYSPITYTFNKLKLASNSNELNNIGEGNEFLEQCVLPWISAVYQ